MSEIILYRNWRGETSVRRIRIDAIAYGNEALGLCFGRNEWHPEEQWILFAHDVDKGERRGFAMAGILAWGEQAVADREAALSQARADALAQGRREGLEEALDIAEAEEMVRSIGAQSRPARDAIRERLAELATAPAETQIPQATERGDAPL